MSPRHFRNPNNQRVASRARHATNGDASLQAGEAEADMGAERDENEQEQILGIGRDRPKHRRRDSASDATRGASEDQQVLGVGGEQTHRRRRHARVRSKSKSAERQQVYGLEHSPSHHHKTERRHRGNRVSRRSVVMAIVGCGLMAVFVALCVSAVALSQLEKSMSLDSEQEKVVSALVSEREATEESQNNGYYLLFVGSDAREGDESSRGDVLMLVRLDPVEHVVTLVSIPRDTMVSIAGAVGTQKINAAYAYGGASSAVYEISRFAGVPISHYVEVDFEGLEKVVDLLGGVWVDVPEAVTVGDKELKAGPQMLDGETALLFARERYTTTSGDFGRAQSQRLVLQAIIRKMMLARPAELPNLVKSVAACVSTDYSLTEVMSVARKLHGEHLTVYSAVCPSYALWQDDIAYVGTMFDEWRDMMKRVDAGLDPNDTSAEIPEPQASNEKLGEAVNSEAPKDYHELAEEAMTTNDVAEAEDVTEID